MDKNNIKKKYWSMVWKEIRRTALRDADMRNHFIYFIGIFILGIFLFIFYWTGKISISFFNSLILNIYFEILIFIIPVTIFFILLIKSLAYIPARLYEERGGFIKNPFLLNADNPKKDSKEDEDKWASIEVNNISPSDNIEDCFLMLNDISDLKTGRSIIEKKMKLTWSGREQNKKTSGNEPIKIIAESSAVCDVARTDLKNLWGNRAYYTSWGSSQEVNKGEYSLKFIVYGNFQNHPINYHYQVILNYEGGNKISIYNPILVTEN